MYFPHPTLYTYTYGAFNLNSFKNSIQLSDLRFLFETEYLKATHLIVTFKSFNFSIFVAFLSQNEPSEVHIEL